MDLQGHLLYIDITQICGIGCAFCMYADKHKAGISMELSTLARENLARLINAPEVKRISVSGEGEPLNNANPMPYRVLLLILALTPALASSATLDERLGDLEHAFKPDLDGTTSAKPASPPPERFKLAPLGSVVRKKECATSILPDEQSSCAALEFCTDCAQ